MSEALIEGCGTPLGTPLTQFLCDDNLDVGETISYEQCKLIYAWHPLGAKMAESPISMAQSQKRVIAVQSAPKEVVQEFETHWAAMGCDSTIHNVYSLSRVYGISSVVLGNEQVKSNVPLDMWKIHDQKIFFNVLDPLNTAGSLVLSQIPTAADFNKPVTVKSSGQTFHQSRCSIVMNEHPIYILYTNSGFGYVGRSVYQRALFPLKSFIATMQADDMIAQKLGFLIAKQKQPGSFIDNLMQAIGALKRTMLKGGRTGNVLTVGHEDDITTLNMQNVDGAGTYSRTNILKNIATAADMPAKLLENETMVAGFGEGTEDAKNIARYIDRIRMHMEPTYKWLDNIIMYRAWSLDFYKQIQAKYPDLYKARDYKEVFLEWRAEFEATWPSVLIEPESEEVDKDKVKLEAIISLLETMLPLLDPKNKALMIQTALDNINENKRMFAHEFILDMEELEGFLVEQVEQQKQLALAGAEDDEDTGEAKKFGKFGG